MFKGAMGNEANADKVALIFEECLEFSDPVKRSAFLDSACPEQDGVREEVENLLRAHEESGLFLMGGLPPAETNSDDASEKSVVGLGTGDCIGPYRLIGLIGEGSTSTVFLAEQEDPVRRWVALKIVKPGMDSRNVILRFGLERQALALMDHPGIAKLLDAGATPSGRPFFVMELVSGVTITDYCDEHELSIPQRLELFNQVCNAVFHAHQRGIIHRDLKPENILVSHCDGRAVLKIVDFGIAKVLHTWGLDSATCTSPMPFMGTPAYMSPEQIHMTKPDLDTRTDIYSLGALLYEILMGHPPFDPEALLTAGLEGMCHIIRTVDPVAPSERFARLPLYEKLAVCEARGATVAQLQRSLSGDLDWITLKALEKSRDMRYGTAAGLAKDIKRHFDHLPVAAAAQTWRYRTGKLLQRKRKLVITTAMVGVMLMASVILVMIMAFNARASANQARIMEKTATQAEKQSHNAMVAMHVSSGLSAAEDRYPDRAVLWFANASGLAGDGSYQGQVNAHRALSWMGEVSLPLGAIKHDSTILFMEFSQDSRFLLTVGRDHDWHIWDALTQEVLSWTKGVGPIRAAAWGQDGSRLAVVLPDGELRVYGVEGGLILNSIEGYPLTETVGFTPDGRYLIFGDSALRAYDLDNNRMIENFPQISKAYVGLNFSTLAGQVVGVTEDSRARVFEIRDGSEKELRPIRDFPHLPAIRVDACSNKSNYSEGFLESAVLSLPSLAADGTRLLTRTGTYDVTFWELVGGDSVFRIDDVCCSCRFITSEDANLVACGLQGGKVGLWETATGKQHQLLPSQGACILDIAFGMKGSRLITAETNGMARLWSVEEGKQLQPPLHHCTDVNKVAFANDGRMVATGQSDGLVRVWHVFDSKPDEHFSTEKNFPSIVRMDSKREKFILTKEPGWDRRRSPCASQITVYPVVQDEPMGVTLPFEACVETAAFSPDSSMLVVGFGPVGNPTAGRLEFYDINSGFLSGNPLELPSKPISVAWNPQGEEVAVICESGELLVVRPGTDRVVRWSRQISPILSRIIPTTQFTHDGQTLVSLGPDGVIQVRDGFGGQLRYPYIAGKSEGFWSFDLSNDNRHMATATVSGEVTVWNLEEGVLTGDLLQHPGWVYRCRFSPYGNLLVTVAHDGEVRLWDWRSGTLEAGPFVHPEEVYDAAFTPDNRWIVTTCRDGNVRIWDPRSGKLVAPLIKVGQQASNIEFTEDGGNAVIGSLGSEVFVLSLGILQEKLPYDADDLKLLGEVVSACTVENGAIRDLMTPEWLDRYDRIRERHPELLQREQSYGLKTFAFEKVNELNTHPSPVDLMTKQGQKLPVNRLVASDAGVDTCLSCSFNGLPGSVPQGLQSR